jgi:hypothetical protein
MLLASLPAGANSGCDGVRDIKGTFTLDHTCTSGCSGTYSHTMNVQVQNPDGTFSGNGNYIPNPAYTWDVDGTILGSTLNFELDYTGLNPSYNVTATGTISGTGDMSGTATSNTNQEFTWGSTSGSATCLDVTATDIPEFPTAALPVGVAVLGYLFVRRRK